MQRTQVINAIRITFVIFREGFLASIAKTLQKKVAAAGIVPSGSSTASDNDNLEDSMRKVSKTVL